MHGPAAATCTAAGAFVINTRWNVQGFGHVLRSDIGKAGGTGKFPTINSINERSAIGSRICPNGACLENAVG